MMSFRIDWQTTSIGWRVGAISRCRCLAFASGYAAAGWWEKVPVVIVLANTQQVVATDLCGQTLTDDQLRELDPDIARQVFALR